MTEDVLDRDLRHASASGSSRGRPVSTSWWLAPGTPGCEAAAAAARMGASVAVVTLHRHTIAQMPCNPAIGGIGKGHLVAELDALGGLQGWAADRAGIQFKILNAISRTGGVGSAGAVRQGALHARSWRGCSAGFGA